LIKPTKFKRLEKELLPIPSCMNGFVNRSGQVEKKGRKKPEEDRA